MNKQQFVKSVGIKLLLRLNYFFFPVFLWPLTKTVTFGTTKEPNNNCNNNANLENH